MSMSFSSATTTTITVNASYTGATDNAKFYADGNYNDSRALDGTNTTHSFSFTYTGLSPSTSYSLTVHWYNGATDLGSNTITASTTAPPAPSALTGLSGFAYISAEPGIVAFSWSASTPVTSYSWALRKNGITINSGSTTDTFISFSSLTAGTYTLGVTPFNGTTSGVGDTSNGVVITPPRPDNFYWTGGDKVAGTTTITVLADDWNSLINRINAFRIYKGLSTTSMTTVSSGNFISAAVYNQLANAINAMNPPGGMVATVNSGTSYITAFAINRLNACLNTII